jgi:hypothetical protein
MRNKFELQAERPQCFIGMNANACLVQALIIALFRQYKVQQNLLQTFPEISGILRNSPDFFRTHFSIKNSTNSILENSGGKMSHFDKVGVRTGHADVHVMRIIRRENRTSQPKPSDACGAISFRLSPLDLGRNEWVTMEHEVLNVLFFVDLQIS